jgi:5-methylcytosine-specific restriction endonuclease McrA
MATFRRNYSSHGELARAKRKIDRYLKGWAPPEPKLSLSRNHHTSVTRLVFRDGPSCYLCGRTLDRSQYHIEHIIPRSRGGTNHPANLALACHPCNYRKADMYVSIRVEDRIPCFHLA